MLAYGLIAAGQVPHMVFLVDFVARGLDAGIAAGAAYWVLFGLGATAGPTVAGLVADRIGFAAALRAALALQIAAVACLLVASDAVTLSLSSLVIGAFVPGNVPLVLGRTQEIFTDPRERQSAWSTATVVFARRPGGLGLWSLRHLRVDRRRLSHAVRARRARARRRVCRPAVRRSRDAALPATVEIVS